MANSYDEYLRFLQKELNITPQWIYQQIINKKKFNISYNSYDPLIYENGILYGSRNIICDIKNAYNIFIGYVNHNNSRVCLNNNIIYDKEVLTNIGEELMEQSKKFKVEIKGITLKIEFNGLNRSRNPLYKINYNINICCRELDNLMEFIKKI